MQEITPDSADCVVKLDSQSQENDSTTIVVDAMKTNPLERDSGSADINSGSETSVPRILKPVKQQKD